MKSVTPTVRPKGKSKRGFHETNAVDAHDSLNRSRAPEVETEDARNG